MSDFAGRAVTRAIVSNVIVRACALCGHAREAGEPCAGCGNPDPPAVHDLGVQSAYYRNPLKRAAWLLAGQRMASVRARKASRPN